MGIVAIIGKPNVGKSALFNKIIEQRLSIVDDLPGVTRDRIYGTATWLTKKFKVIDTGGICDVGPFHVEVNYQATLATTEADIIIFVVDGQAGINQDDNYIAKLLYPIKEKVIVANNKIDNLEIEQMSYDVYSLGFNEVVNISVVHNKGIANLLDKIITRLDDSQLEEDNAIIFTLLGRPNVGKSSLANAIINEERVIVSNISGTTRDAISIPFTYLEKKFSLIDTAGIIRPGLLKENLDKFVINRTELGLDNSEIALLILDASEGIKEQDLHIFGLIEKYQKPLIIVVNKWDLVTESTKTDFNNKLDKALPFISYVPRVFTSALTKLNINSLLDTIITISDNKDYKINTNILNRLFLDAQIANPPSTFGGGIFKIYYAFQVDKKIPTFMLFVNNKKYLHFSYQRYLENRIREIYNFNGYPLSFIFKKH